MSDPLRDLGNLSFEAGFSGNQDREMMDACFDANGAPAQYGRMVVYKAMSDLLRALWDMNTAADDNSAEDFRGYSAGRFNRCRALMNGSDFARHLDAVRAGCRFSELFAERASNALAAAPGLSDHPRPGAIPRDRPQVRHIRSRACRAPTGDRRPHP